MFRINKVPRLIQQILSYKYFFWLKKKKQPAFEGTGAVKKIATVAKDIKNTTASIPKRKSMFSKEKDSEEVSFLDNTKKLNDSKEIPSFHEYFFDFRIKKSESQPVHVLPKDSQDGMTKDTNITES